jgi:transcriptional regulator with XRE-family HTH domain
MIMTPEQCRMARAGLSISTRELADAARVSVSTITRFEAGQSIPSMTVGLFQKALERQGVDFVSNGPAVGLWLSRAPGLAAAISVEGLNATNDE